MPEIEREEKDFEAFVIGVKARLIVMRTSTNLTRVDTIVVYGCFHMETTRNSGITREQEAASMICSLRNLNGE